MRLGSTTLFSALDIATCEVIWQLRRRRRASGFLASRRLWPPGRAKSSAGSPRSPTNTSGAARIAPCA